MEATTTEKKEHCVLIVEDDLMTCFYLKHALAPKYNVHIINTAQEAVEYAERYCECVMLIDINLGMGKTGMEIVSDVRSVEHCKNTKIVAITHENVTAPPHQFLQQGFDAFLPKPIKLANLHTTLKELIKD
ncbi:MAG: response regulator [Bacteroidota bacterium]